MAQAREVGERFANWRLEGLYCSDLARARQTAELIASAAGLEPVVEPGLREIALGEWEGKTREELIDGYPDLWERWAAEPNWDLVPGGEGAGAFAARVRDTMTRLRERHPHGDVLCVTHGGLIQVAVLDVVGAASRGFFAFRIENCSLTMIQRTAHRTIVTAVNDTCHLAGGS